MCLYLHPERVASALILLLAEEPPLQPNGTVQLVLDLQVGRDQKHFGGAALPVWLMAPWHVLRVFKFSWFTEELNISPVCKSRKYNYLHTYVRRAEVCPCSYLQWRRRQVTKVRLSSFMFKLNSVWGKTTQATFPPFCRLRNNGYLEFQKFLRTLTNFINSGRQHFPSDLKELALITNRTVKQEAAWLTPGGANRKWEKFDRSDFSQSELTWALLGLGEIPQFIIGTEEAGALRRNTCCFFISL